MMNNINKFVSNYNYMLLTCIILVAFSLLTYYFPIEIDITRNNSNSISKESKVALKNLDIKNVEVTYLSAIISPTTDYEILNRVSALFKQFRKYNNHIKYKIVDLTNNPDEISNYEYTDMKGSFIIKYKDKTILIPPQEFAQKTNNALSISVENILISELSKLEDESNYKIYYTTNHNEGLISDDYSNFMLLMETRGYKFIPINLSKDDTSDIKCLYIISPSIDFSLDEISKLENLINNGTNVFITLRSGRTNAPGEFINLKDLAKKIGILVEDDLIIDQIQDTNLIGVYDELDKSEKYIEELNSIVYLPNSRRMQIIDSSYNPSVLMTSGELSSNFNKDIYASFPLVIRIVYQNAKILISATPELLNNTYLPDNRHFIAFLTNWIDGFDKKFDITPFTYTEYITNPNEFKPSLIFGIIRIIIPCTILFYAIEIKIKREESIKKNKSKKKFTFKFNKKIRTNKKNNRLTSNSNENMNVNCTVTENNNNGSNNANNDDSNRNN